MDFRTLDNLLLFIPGFEHLQIKKRGWKVSPLDPHQEEPIYWPSFHWIVNIRFLHKNKLRILKFEKSLVGRKIFPSGPHEEPENLKRRRSTQPRFIQLPPSGFNMSVPIEALPVIPKIIHDEVDILEGKIAFYADCEANGKPELHQGEDYLEALDCLSHHLLQAAFDRNQCHQ